MFSLSYVKVGVSGADYTHHYLTYLLTRLGKASNTRLLLSIWRQHNRHCRVAENGRVSPIDDWLPNVACDLSDADGDFSLWYSKWVTSVGVFSAQHVVLWGGMKLLPNNECNIRKSITFAKKENVKALQNFAKHVKWRNNIYSQFIKEVIITRLKIF